MSRLLNWLRAHPLFTGACAVALLFWAMHEFLNWQAERRWHRYVEEARRRGVKLTLPEFAPPHIPDEQNFAALPMMRAAFAGQGAFQLPSQIGARQRPGLGDPINGEPLDWRKWQEHLKAAAFLTETTDDPIRDVLRALEQFEPQFREWREWPRRPHSRFPLGLAAAGNMRLHHLGTLQNAANIFAIRMRAHLALGDSAAAYADFQDALQAYRALKDEPTLISSLVRVSVLSALCARAGAGLAERAWAARELEKIQRDFGEVRVWDDYRLGLGSERGFYNSFLGPVVEAPARERMRLFSGLATGFPPGGPLRAVGVLGLLPRRVFRDNQLRHNRFFDEMLARVDATGKRFDVDAPLPSSPELLSGLERYYFFIFGAAMPGYSEIEQRYLQLDTQLNQARVACALERFRLARGAYPATLAELVPEFIEAVPEDPFAGAPLKYARTEDGSFRLYSVGKNRADDGAVINPKKSERQQLDAIWLYAPKPTPTAPRDSAPDRSRAPSVPPSGEKAIESASPS